MPKRKNPDIYEAVDSFTTGGEDGYWMTVVKGQTFDADHWLVRKHPHLFKVLQPRYPVEQATAAPGELRGE